MISFLDKKSVKIIPWNCDTMVKLPGGWFILRRNFITPRGRFMLAVFIWAGFTFGGDLQCTRILGKLIINWLLTGEKLEIWENRDGFPWFLLPVIFVWAVFAHELCAIRLLLKRLQYPGGGAAGLQLVEIWLVRILLRSASRASDEFFFQWQTRSAQNFLDPPKMAKKAHFWPFRAFLE